MVVTMISVRMMQVAVDHIVHMITMWNCRVTTHGCVDMASRDFVDSMARSALRWVDSVYGYDMLINM
jgi:hypothetical protein